MDDIEKALAAYLGEVCGMRLRPHALTGLAQAAIAAMQPSPQEPLAWMYEQDGRMHVSLARVTSPRDAFAGWTETPLYAHPPAPQWQGIESVPPPPRPQEAVMQSDIVQRLQAGVPCCDPDAGNGEGSFFIEDADETMAEAAAEITRLTEALCFIGKWVERGVFDKQISARESLEVIINLPGMPWNSDRWDVDHKPYAAAYYARFPAALKGPNHD